MKTDLKTILIVGSGRLATHLSHWVTLVHHKSPVQILTWDRSQDPHLIKTYVQKADHVWLAISDSAIVSFYEKYLQGFDCSVVHFSGALHDARMICAHPLMSFSVELYPDEIYSKIHFALTGCEKLSEALIDFKNTSFCISPEQKPLYHALCVVAGNLPQMLWSETSKICQQQQIPFKGFELYLRQCVENFISSGESSLTGPLIRQDLATINKNKTALPQNLKNIYQVFQQEFLK